MLHLVPNNLILTAFDSSEIFDYYIIAKRKEKFVWRTANARERFEDVVFEKL